MTCSVAILQDELYSSNPALELREEDGTLIITVPPGETLDPDTTVTIFSLLELRPFFIEWEVGAFGGIIALGINFNGSTALLGTGISNLFYTSDGRIIVHGSVYAEVPPFVPGDTVGMWVDVANSAGMFFLNGERVA